MDQEFNNTDKCPVKDLASGFEDLLSDNKIQDLIIDEGDIELF